MSSASRETQPTLPELPSASELPRPREETLDVLFDISQLLETGLDRETLAILVGLTETGVNPEALAEVVKELRRESAALEAANQRLESAANLAGHLRAGGDPDQEGNGASGGAAGSGA